MNRYMEKGKHVTKELIDMRDDSPSNVVMGDFTHDGIKMSMEQWFSGDFTEGSDTLFEILTDSMKIR